MSQQLKLLVLGSVLWEYEFCIKFHAFGSPCEDKYVISSIASGLLWWVWLYQQSIMLSATETNKFFEVDGACLEQHICINFRGQVSQSFSLKLQIGTILAKRCYGADET